MSGASEWSQGYVTDTLYTENHYRELSPAWINYAALLNGCLPRPTDRDFTYIELGCGHGRTVMHLAAAFPKGRFYGVDFNPAHIDSATRYAAALGIGNVQFLERGFQDLVGAGKMPVPDLPDFDFIALHGVYSWISVEARQAVQRLIFEKLKPGGLVYNSYNCLPGWAAEAPVRRLFVEFAAVEQGGSGDRMKKALAHAGELQALKAGYLARYPAVGEAIAQHLKRPANYMAHEYLNADWNPFYSVDVADEMAAAKLDFAGAATLMENHLDLMMNDNVSAFVTRQPTARLRQLMKDFLYNQRFRRDVFVRGHARLGPAEIMANLRGQSFIALKPMSGNKLTVPRGEISFDGEILPSLNEIFAAGSVTLEEAAKAITKKGGKTGGLERVINILAASGTLAPAAYPYRPVKAYAPPARLRFKHAANQHLLQRVMARSDSSRAIIVPAYGNIVTISIPQAFILNEMLTGGTTTDLVTRSIAAIERRGFKLQKDNHTLTESEAKQAHMAQLVTGFIDKDLPLLLRGGAVDVA
ncbi:class I SAM-dependent methyltransferase [Dongia soli]|uniref:Class I SAM-dependent methyltransferase n=1 Tax=Dongia soli TaxID=600628 RepID=A0ABU5EF91_9PROT|nr:class I SAM-dependent methyltransferase [Dongia soli]MDY0885070.1 class I SAM-dependent methyltransferase [Dongia soli]